jgi:hypothetical protein
VVVVVVVVVVCGWRACVRVSVFKLKTHVAEETEFPGSLLRVKTEDEHRHL